MDIKRIARHLTMTHWQVARAFPHHTMNAIEQAIKSSEAMHRGEVRFVVEGALESAPLLRGQSARDRAIDVFAQLRIWDTDQNNGVLIYLLLADRDVEIVADRGIHARTEQGEWESICSKMEIAFRTNNFESGVISGIEAITQQLRTHFPARGSDLNELPDQPLVL